MQVDPATGRNYGLATGGIKVLLLDKRNSPRSKACECGLTRKALRAVRYSVDAGMELAISRSVVEPYDGRLPARGKVGATFSIELPRQVGGPA